MVNVDPARRSPAAEAPRPGNAIKWCSVPLSEVLDHGRRLEASVFDIEAKQARTAIAHGRYPLTTLCGENGLASAYVCGRFKRIWVESSQLPIYQPSAITDLRPEPDGYLSPRTKTDIDALRVHKGQVLLTCSGTVGKVAYVSDTLDGKIFSHDLLRIDCKTPEDAGYIYAYLKSRTGSKLLLANRYGAVITHIEPEHLATVPIPDTPAELKSAIHARIVQSYALRDEANRLLDEATARLGRELRLPDIAALEAPLSQQGAPLTPYSVKLSALAGRLDASYHVPVVDAIVAHLKTYAAEVTTVGDRRISQAVILPVRFKRVYVEETHGRVLIGGKQLHELDPSGKKYLSNTRQGGLLDALEVHENTTLITRSGTIGKVAMVPKHWEHWVPSDHIIRIVPAGMDIAGYLYVFLASDYGRRLATRYTYGSVVDEIDDAQVRAIPLPLLRDHRAQREINDLALAANRKRFEAYQKEQQALEMLRRDVLGET